MGVFQPQSMPVLEGVLGCMLELQLFPWGFHFSFHLITAVTAVATVVIAIARFYVTFAADSAGGEASREEDAMTMMTTVEGATPFTYTLTKYPGNLYVLWQE
jgi:hypothetical protein